MIDLSLLETLKMMVVEAEDFAEPWNYFFDHFGDHVEFLDMGKVVKAPMLTSLCKQLPEQVHGRTQPIRRKLFRHLKEHKFVHGTANYDHEIIVLFYFTDIDMGMASLSTMRESKLIRFSAYQVRNKELAFPPRMDSKPN